MSLSVGKNGRSAVDGMLEHVIWIARCLVGVTLAGTLVMVANWAHAVQPQVVTKGLDHPWAVAFLPAGRFLVTERPGQLRVVEPDGRLGAPITGLPDIAA